MPRSPPSSSGSRSMSSLRRDQQLPRQRRRHRSSRLFLRCQGTWWPLALWRVSPDQAATLPGCPCSSPMLLASDSNSCERLFPVFARLAIMVNVGFPDAVVVAGATQAAARSIGIQAATLEIRRAEDIVPAFESLKDHADALYVTADALLNANRVRINTLALKARLPTMHYFRELAEAGGLMSYGPNFASMFRRAAEYVDKILRGAKPADLPVEQPTKFDLIINLTTAKALGLNITERFLLRTDEVIGR